MMMTKQTHNEDDWTVDEYRNVVVTSLNDDCVDVDVHLGRDDLAEMMDALDEDKKKPPTTIAVHAINAGEIAAMCVRVSLRTVADVFCDYSPHVGHVYITVHRDGWVAGEGGVRGRFRLADTPLSTMSDWLNEQIKGVDWT